LRITSLPTTPQTTPDRHLVANPGSEGSVQRRNTATSALRSVSNRGRSPSYRSWPAPDGRLRGMTTRPAEARRTRHPSADFNADGKYTGDPGRRRRVRQRELGRLPGHGETVAPGTGPRGHALRGTDSPANGRTLADNAPEVMLSSSPARLRPQTEPICVKPSPGHKFPLRRASSPRFHGTFVSASNCNARKRKLPCRPHRRSSNYR
jgi:hypothetical protein